MLWKSRVNCFEVCLACKTTLEYNCFLARLSARFVKGARCSLLVGSRLLPPPHSLIHFPNWLYVRLRRLKFHHPDEIARTQDGLGIGTRRSPTFPFVRQSRREFRSENRQEGLKFSFKFLIGVIGFWSNFSGVLTLFPRCGNFVRSLLWGEFWEFWIYDFHAFLSVRWFTNCVIILVS